MDLAAINALARPGPLHSGTTGDYIAIRHGRMEYEELHPIVSDICKDTEGQIIYQEQILQICRVIGKFPWVHAATIRKVISQKKGEAAFNTLWEDFKKGAAENGIDEALADKIWRRMVTAGTYSFNIAHCISYSMLGFWAMWLKVHHPLAFYAAKLQKTPVVKDGKNKALSIMRDMQDKRFGRDYEILPPDPVKSGITWTAGEGGVQAGFAQIPGIGDVRAAEIVEHRAHAPFDDWIDMVAVKGIGMKTVEKIREFAEQDDPFEIHRLEREAALIKRFIKRGDLPVPMPDTLAQNIPYEAVRSGHVILGQLRNRNLQDLFENHRSRTGQELDPADVKDPELKDSMTLYLEDRSGLMTVKVNRWKYPEYKARLWSATLDHDWILAVVVKKPFYGKTVHVQRLWVIDPD